MIVDKLISASHSYTATSYLDAIPADLKADLSKSFSYNLYLGRCGFSYWALRRNQEKDEEVIQGRYLPPRRALALTGNQASVPPFSSAM